MKGLQKVGHCSQGCTGDLLQVILLALVQALPLQMVEMMKALEEGRKNSLPPPVQVTVMIRNHGGGEETKSIR